MLGALAVAHGQRGHLCPFAWGSHLGLPLPRAAARTGWLGQGRSPQRLDSGCHQLVLLPLSLVAPKASPMPSSLGPKRGAPSSSAPSFSLESVTCACSRPLAERSRSECVLAFLLPRCSVSCFAPRAVRSPDLTCLLLAGNTLGSLSKALLLQALSLLVK
jgi:hypothetical protein